MQFIKKGEMRMDELYSKYIGQPAPKAIQCFNCNWTGNKVKTVKFKKVTQKHFCPNCGERNLGCTADLVFWRTANGHERKINFEDLVKGVTH